jgi:hypothetical protein
LLVRLLLLLVLLLLLLVLLLLSVLVVAAVAAAVAAVGAVVAVDRLEHHYYTWNCLYDSCIIAAPARMGSSGPLPGLEYSEEDRGPFEIVQDGTGDRVNKSEYRHRAPPQKLTAAPTSSYSTLSNST